MPGRLVTERWSIELPDGWTADRTGERIQLIPSSSTARIVVSDLQLQLSRATPQIVASSLRSLLDGSKATIDRVEEQPATTEDGRLVAMGQGRSDQGFCSAAAHAWPGTVLLLSLFQVDDGAAIREQASAIFGSVRRVDAPPASAEAPAVSAPPAAPAPERAKSLLRRLLGR